MNETVHIVEVFPDEEKRFVAYYYGEKEHNGKTYKIVSPYRDDRTKHWLELETPMRTIVSLLER